MRRCAYADPHVQLSELVRRAGACTARLGNDANEPCNSSARLAPESACNEETGESDRDQVFEQSDENVFDMQRGDQARSDFQTSKRSDYAADSAQNRADD